MVRWVPRPPARLGLLWHWAVREAASRPQCGTVLSCAFDSPQGTRRCSATQHLGAAGGDVHGRGRVPSLVLPRLWGWSHWGPQDMWKLRGMQDPREHGNPNVHGPPARLAPTWHRAPLWHMEAVAYGPQGVQGPQCARCPGAVPGSGSPSLGGGCPSCWGTGCHVCAHPPREEELRETALKWCRERALSSP